MIRHSIFAPTMFILGFWSYPALFLMLYTRSFYTFIISVTIGLLVHGITRLKSFQNWYADWIINNAEDVIFLGDSLKERETVGHMNLLVPHGFFCMGGATVHLKLQQLQKMYNLEEILFIDHILYRFSLPVKTLIEAQGIGVQPLSHKNITEHMKKGNNNLYVFPGGFVEAAGMTNDEECMYTEKYTYYQKQCRKYGYSLQMIICYNGTTFYSQPSFARDFRVTIAKKNMPFVLPLPIMKRPKMFVRRIQIDIDKPLDKLKQELYDQYMKDKEFIKENHGIDVKKPHIL